jgi:hypothetical protein
MLSEIVTEPAAQPVEIVDGEPVTGTVLEAPAPGGAIEVSNRQVAALAATGFMAGAATVAVLGRRAGVRRAKRRKKKGVLGEVVSSNSFLVDVHLLKR